MWKIIKEIFLTLFYGSICEDCNKGRLKLHMFDLEHDMAVFKCDKCNKEYC